MTEAATSVTPAQDATTEPEKKLVYLAVPMVADDVETEIMEEDDYQKPALPVAIVELDQSKGVKRLISKIERAAKVLKQHPDVQFKSKPSKLRFTVVSLPNPEDMDEDREGLDPDGWEMQLLDKLDCGEHVLLTEQEREFLLGYKLEDVENLRTRREAEGIEIMATYLLDGRWVAGDWYSDTCFMSGLISRKDLEGLV